jgi:cAMP-specific phosphodiesterase 4
LTAFGFSLYFTYVVNITEILFLAIAIVWAILDLANSSNFRVLGAYRLYRVGLLYIRFYHTKVHLEACRMESNKTSSTKTPLKQVFGVLAKLRNDIKDSRVINELSHCIDVISSGNLYNDVKPAPNSSEEDALKWARKNTTDSTSRNPNEKQMSLHYKLQNYDIDKELNISKTTRSILDTCKDYEFDIFALERATGGNEMIVCATDLLQKHHLFDTLSIDPHTFTKFISVIQNGYYDVAYHNKIHGMDVGRLAYYYATECELMEKAQLSEQDLFALILGGACHDYEHLGWNNIFLIETQHDLAITYNDISVCENHHIAATFEVLKSKPG